MKQVDTKNCIMQLEQDLLQVYFKPGKVDLEDAKHIVSTRRELIGEQKVYMVVYDQVVTKLTRSARNYFASFEGTDGVDAAAFVINRQFTKIMVNYLLKVSKPNKPAKMFVSENKAIE